jgi:hypothetical protein
MAKNLSKIYENALLEKNFVMIFSHYLLLVYYVTLSHYKLTTTRKSDLLPIKKTSSKNYYLYQFHLSLFDQEPTVILKMPEPEPSSDFPYPQPWFFASDYG